MICGAADEGSAALFVCGGTEPDPGVGGREWRLDSPGGRIGVRLLWERWEF